MIFGGDPLTDDPLMGWTLAWVGYGGAVEYISHMRPMCALVGTLHHDLQMIGPSCGRHMATVRVCKHIGCFSKSGGQFLRVPLLHPFSTPSRTRGNTFLETKKRKTPKKGELLFTAREVLSFEASSAGTSVTWGSARNKPGRCGKPGQRDGNKP